MSDSESQPNRQPSGLTVGKKYRFTVATAEEAVTTIRRRFGERARVLSVKQIEGRGLGRFLKSPKLEIVAEITEDQRPFSLKGSPESKAEAPKAEKPRGKKSVTPEMPKEVAESPDEAQKPIFPTMEDSPESPVVRGAEVGDYHPGRAHISWRSILERAGFEPGLLAGWEVGKNGQRLKDLPVDLALAEIAEILREETHSVQRLEPQRRMAFMGTPGSGTTTALSKWMIAESIVRGEEIQVARLEGEGADGDDTLGALCEVAGLELLREPFSEDDLSENAKGLFDLPGIPLRDRDAWQAAANRLDELEVRTRVLVLHAGYDRDLHRLTIEVARKAGATHLVLTHLDEVEACGRLWPIVLRSGLNPFYLCEGGNLTADHREDVAECLLTRTFPSSLLT